ncbi:MAG TPA: prolyl oligopeptidase family serine peptidase [Thermomicrobiales bacterium]|nr:prolyl oligopeptidase family serine peptidase [Thermomicrobiales bacterium]
MEVTKHDMEATPSIATRREDVVEVLHGHQIHDPYRWLEDGSSDETRAWTRDQNARTEAVLAGIPGREQLEGQLRELLQVGSVTGARETGGRFFYTRREGSQDQAVLYVREGLDGEERTLLDPSAQGEHGLVALDWWEPSHDGTRLAYGVSQGGDEWSVLHVFDVGTGEDLDEAIPRARAASVAWLPDNNGFYYTRYPLPGSVPDGELHYHRRVFFHLIGSDYHDDPLVFGGDRPKELLPAVSIEPTGRWVIVEENEGWIRTGIYVLDRQHEEAGFRDITPDGAAIHEVLGIDNGVLYDLTQWQAPNGQIAAYSLENGNEKGQAAWSTVVAGREDRVIEYAAITPGGIVTGELEAAMGKVRRYGRDGSSRGDLGLPGIGSITGLHASPSSDIVVVGYQSFVQPPTALVYQGDDQAPVELSPVAPPPGFDPDTCEIRQVWYASKDGQNISMFLVHRKGLELDGSNPVYLTGYGGFNVTRGSEYQPALPFWLGHGGVFALPNLRGGAEYGAAWHEAGMLAVKQNTFNDFIAAAEYLIAEGYTRPERLGIAGGSNGGLLVGAVVTQRPELFRAAICMVPLLDMLRYHLFRIARLWIPEYGSSEDAEQFAWLHAYSPYHAVREGVEYPAMLLTLGENDSRVDPMHARKMTALLQRATGSGADRPILLRAESDAGHGQGKPLWMRVQEAADLWGFMSWQLGIDLA